MFQKEEEFNRCVPRRRRILLMCSKKKKNLIDVFQKEDFFGCISRSSSCCCLDSSFVKKVLAIELAEIPLQHFNFYRQLQLVPSGIFVRWWLHIDYLISNSGGGGGWGVSFSLGNSCLVGLNLSLGAWDTTKRECWGDQTLFITTTYESQFVHELPHFRSDFVLWHIKYRRSFNAKFCLYIYIKYICGL